MFGSRDYLVVPHDSVSENCVLVSPLRVSTLPGCMAKSVHLAFRNPENIIPRHCWCQHDAARFPKFFVYLDVLIAYLYAWMLAVNWVFIFLFLKFLVLIICPY